MSFSFGAKPTTTGAPATTTGGFSFGGTSTNTAGGGTGGFSFGAPPKTTTAAASGGFSFGVGLGGMFKSIGRELTIYTFYAMASDKRIQLDPLLD